MSPAALQGRQGRRGPTVGPQSGRSEAGSRWTDREKEAPVLPCVWTPWGPRGGGVSFTGCSDGRTVAGNGPTPRATVVQ